MNTPNIGAGQQERRVGRETMPGIHGFCSFYSFGAIRGVPLLRLTALMRFVPLRILLAWAVPIFHGKATYFF